MSPELLRAWERRYGLLQPTRSDGNLRLYTSEEAVPVEQMKRALDEGLSAPEAARRALTPARPSDAALEHAREGLVAAAHAYDEAAVHSVLDQALAGSALETVLRELILPVLREIGYAWERGELEIGEEHFATSLIRERLLALSRFRGRGDGALAILACAPGERHDIGLIAFGLVLRSHGWRILFLGADTPIQTLAEAVAATEAASSSSWRAWTARCSSHWAASCGGSHAPRGSCSRATDAIGGTLRALTRRPARRRPRGRGRDRRAGMSSEHRILITAPPATSAVGSLAPSSGSPEPTVVFSTRKTSVSSPHPCRLNLATGEDVVIASTAPSYATLRSAACCPAHRELERLVPPIAPLLCRAPPPGLAELEDMCGAEVAFAPRLEDLLHWPKVASAKLVAVSVPEGLGKPLAASASR